MNKNSIGQNWLNANPEYVGLGHFTFDDKGRATGWMFDKPLKEGESIMAAVVFTKHFSLRKKDRATIRLKRNYKRFETKCNKCVSYDKDKNFCNDLELPMEKMWNYGKFKFGVHCSECNHRCSWFKNKSSNSHVK